MANPRYNSQVANKRVAKKDGGMMKPVDKKKNPGLAKLPKAVRNKMGYMKKGGMIDKRNKASKEFFKFAKGEKPRVKKAVGGMLKKVSRDFKKMKPLSKPSSPGPTRPAPEQLPNKPMRRFKRQKEK